ncbi:MAG: TRAP transporter small permease subunit [Deltaproteobacteria bacterium]|nr:TRAP transporter small permease subunit [Deltaproteobacteria bacterium]
MTGSSPRRSTAQIIRSINTFTLWVEKIFSLTVVVMALSICWEVFCRYLLDSPTDWVNETNQYLLCLMSMLGGSYCLLVDQHVRVDFFFRLRSDKQKALMELMTWWLAALFCVVIIWWGGEMAIEALVKNKLSNTILEMPLWPSMFMVPLGALLLLLQIVSRSLKNLLILKHPSSDLPGLLEELGLSKSFFE